MRPDLLSHRRWPWAVIALTLLALCVVLLTHPPTSVRQVGFACDQHSCWSVDPPPHHSGTIFVSGAIDLTGDGMPENIERVENRLRVFQNDAEIYRSDPAWQVVDVALGDPNDDGRYEILAALWKADDSGEYVCHPYIIAHRGGTVKLIWGGSAVSYPILELELADVDGDGIQELVALEAAQLSGARATPYRTLSIWDWHGWGFNLRWRSEAARYEGLGIAPNRDGDIILLTMSR